MCNCDYYLVIYDVGADECVWWWLGRSARPFLQHAEEGAPPGNDSAADSKCAQEAHQGRAVVSHEARPTEGRSGQGEGRAERGEGGTEVCVRDEVWCDCDYVFCGIVDDIIKNCTYISYIRTPIYMYSVVYTNTQ